jgi:lysozyme
MANETKRLSAAGWTALRTREHAVLHYYNDVANNCTYGIGTLAHHGPCTDEELQRPVSAADVNAQLAVGVSRAEAAVRRQVRDHDLSQDEFDSLVSFTYNMGATGAHPVLRAANGGNSTDVANRMARNVYVYPRDANGRRLPAQRVPGLVNRRREEAAPFRNTQAGQ